MLRKDSQSRPTKHHSLRTLRGIRGQTQIAIANTSRASQSEISRLERRTDMRLGTLARYVHAMGGELVVLAKFDDESYLLELPESTPPPISTPSTIRKTVGKAKAISPLQRSWNLRNGMKRLLASDGPEFPQELPSNGELIRKTVGRPR